MRGASPEEWVAFATAAEDTAAIYRDAGRAATACALRYCEDGLRWIKAGRFVVMALLALLVLTWIGGAVMIFLVDSPQDASAATPTFCAFVSVGVAAMSAVAMWLRHMERDVSMVLRALTNP